MIVNKLTVKESVFSYKIGAIPNFPKQLYVLCNNLQDLLTKPLVAVVGSRKVSSYGRAVTQKIASELAEQGIVIVSGLAIGVDGLAHRSALSAGGQTIAVLPCGLDRIYPTVHHNLAKDILKQGGALISEYPNNTTPFPQNFIARNRIISGLSLGVIITEAATKSGSLHTANFALEQGREVMAVPGNITSPSSEGTNNLIKSGAIPITSTADILQNLDLKQATQKTLPLADNLQEQLILTNLHQGITDGEELLIAVKLQPAIFNQTLTMLEINGKIKSLGNNNWTLS